MLFVSIWGSFAIALFLLNHTDKRRIRPRADIGSIGIPALLLSGFIGGIFTSIAGSGVDIAIFSVLTLFFRVSEKIAPPTSVVLMGENPLWTGYCPFQLWIASSASIIEPSGWRTSFPTPGITSKFAFLSLFFLLLWAAFSDHISIERLIR